MLLKHDLYWTEDTWTAFSLGDSCLNSIKNIVFTFYQCSYKLNSSFGFQRLRPVSLPCFQTFSQNLETQNIKLAAQNLKYCITYMNIILCKGKFANDLTKNGNKLFKTIIYLSLAEIKLFLAFISLKLQLNNKKNVKF